MSSADFLGYLKSIPSWVVNLFLWIAKHLPHPIRARKVKRYSKRFVEVSSKLHQCHSNESGYSFYRTLSNYREVLDAQWDKLHSQVLIFDYWHRHFHDLNSILRKGNDLIFLNTEITHLNMMLGLMGEFCTNYSACLSKGMGSNTGLTNNYNTLRAKFNDFLLKYEEFLADFSKDFPEYPGYQSMSFIRLN